jgi:anti-sigma factor RsiW
MNSRLLDRYLDDELKSKKRNTIDAHLAHCSTCKRYVNDSLLGAQLLRQNLDQAMAGLDFSCFENNVMIGVRNAPSIGILHRLSTWLSEFFYYRRTAILASAVIAVVLLASLIPLISQKRSEQNQNLPNPIQVARSNNDVIIDSMEYAGNRTMIFSVSKNNTTVIWMYDFDDPEADNATKEEI